MFYHLKKERIFLHYLTGFTKFAYRNNQYYFK